MDKERLLAELSFLERDVRDLRDAVGRGMCPTENEIRQLRNELDAVAEAVGYKE